MKLFEVANAQSLVLLKERQFREYGFQDAVNICRGFIGLGNKKTAEVDYKIRWDWSAKAKT